MKLVRVIGAAAFFILPSIAAAEGPPDINAKGDEPRHMEGPKEGWGGRFGGGGMRFGKFGSDNGASPMERFQDRRAMHQKLMDDLNLSQEQRDKLKGLREGRREGMKSLHEEMRNKRSEIWKMMQDKKASEDQILAEVRKANELQGKLSEERVKNLLKMREVLSDEQLSKLSGILQERRKEMFGGEHDEDKGGEPGE